MESIIMKVYEAITTIEIKFVLLLTERIAASVIISGCKFAAGGWGYTQEAEIR
jgi:hypothetical protein